MARDSLFFRRIEKTYSLSSEDVQLMLESHPDHRIEYEILLNPG